MDQEAVISDLERRARIAGVSMRRLCMEAEVHPTTVSRWKKSERNPEPQGATLKTIEKLNSALARVVAENRRAARKAVNA